jgi:hypothetical protein
MPLPDSHAIQVGVFKGAIRFALQLWLVRLIVTQVRIGQTIRGRAKRREVTSDCNLQDLPRKAGCTQQT